MEKSIRTAAIGIVALLLTACYQSKTADLILHNGKIYSCDKDFNVYSAMAIKDGQILELGPEREILNGYSCDNIVNLELKAVYPGFHDGHCHFLGYAQTKNQVDLLGCSSFDEVIKRVETFQNSQNTSYISGRGWDQTLWAEAEFPDNTKLNEMYPNIPVLIRRVDGHAALANEKALEIAGITIESKIEGGFIEKENGILTGILLDNAYDSVAKAMPQLLDTEKEKLLLKAEQDLFAVGLTSINDAGLTVEDRKLFVDLYEKEVLKVRSYGMLFPEDENLDWAMENGIYKEGSLHIRSFKMLADGALGSRGACLIEPYSDDTSNSGFLLQEADEMREICELALELGYQVNTHCIGDKANRVLLEIYAEVLEGVSDHRWKIEHAQVINEDDFDYFMNNAIVPSVQPTHCTSDMRWAEERIGKDRITGAYAYKTLLNKYGKIVLGTDFPVEHINPIYTFFAAVFRKDHDGNPKEGFYSSEALTREEALLGMTIWPAFSNFEHHEKGSLERGKLADFVILSNDIMTADESEVLHTYVEKTYLGGKLVYDAYAFNP